MCALCYKKLAMRAH